MVLNTDCRSCIRYPNVFSFKLSKGKISTEPAQDKRSNLKVTGFKLALKYYQTNESAKKELILLIF